MNQKKKGMLLSVPRCAPLHRGVRLFTEEACASALGCAPLQLCSVALKPQILLFKSLTPLSLFSLKLLPPETLQNPRDVRKKPETTAVDSEELGWRSLVTIGTISSICLPISLCEKNQLSLSPCSSSVLGFSKACL